MRLERRSDWVASSIDALRFAQYILLGLNRFGIDPALSGAVILTTITDVVGFLSFLGLATIFLI